MQRAFFRRAVAPHVTVSGIVIARFQAALNAILPQKIQVDGIFGSATRDMIKLYQNFIQVPSTGEMDTATWAALLHTAEPPMFERALQLTAHFEGTGFTRVVGNFDGAGLTWGIIGFTLSNGELGGILSDIANHHATLFNQAFGSDASVALSKMHLPPAQRVAWGDSISRGPNKMSVAEPWRTYFDDLGRFPEIQELQVRRARDRYWTIAMRDAMKFELDKERDYAFFYDAAVQNGGVTPSRETKIRQRFAASGDKSAEKLRQIIEDVIVETSKAKWQTDVRSRKRAIRTLSGVVHGGDYLLEDWGIKSDVTPTVLQ